MILRRAALASLVVACMLTLPGAPAAGVGAPPPAVTSSTKPSPAPPFDAQRFSKPPSDSRPAILWFWNGEVTPALVDKQMADFRSKGVDELKIFGFNTPDLRPKFFSEAWFDLIDHTLREAQRTGMHLWLANDDIFPSGRAGGFLVNGGTVGNRPIRRGRSCG